MYCPNCGKEIPDNSRFCPECGKEIEKPNKGTEVSAEIVEHPYTDYETHKNANNSNGNSNNADSHKGLAIAGLVLAIIVPIVGLILSIVSLSYYLKNNKDCSEYKMSVAGVIIGAVLSAAIVIRVFYRY